ncbi:hypothetical protein [Tolypothrix sp. VBCCA 56010]
MGHGAWGMGHGKNRIYSRTRASPNFFNSHCPLPIAHCPMPYSQCPFTVV